MSRQTIINTTYDIRYQERRKRSKSRWLSVTATSEQERDEKKAALEAEGWKILEIVPIQHRRSIGTDDICIVVQRRSDETPLFSYIAVGETFEEAHHKADKHIQGVFLSNDHPAYCFDIYEVQPSGIEWVRRELRADYIAPFDAIFAFLVEQCASLLPAGSYELRRLNAEEFRLNLDERSKQFSYARNRLDAAAAAFVEQQAHQKEIR